MIAMRVLGLTMDKNNTSPILLLQAENGKQVLPIWIGSVEAMSISLSLDNVRLERPLTHDLLLGTLEALGARLMSASITSLHEGTFYAKLEILFNEQLVLVDCRPSDAVALALRANAPISVAEEVLKSAPTEAFRLMEEAEQAMGAEKAKAERAASGELTQEQQLARLLQAMEPVSKRRM